MKFSFQSNILSSCQPKSTWSLQQHPWDNQPPTTTNQFNGKKSFETSTFIKLFTHSTTTIKKDNIWIVAKDQRTVQQTTYHRHLYMEWMDVLFMWNVSEKSPALWGWTFYFFSYQLGCHLHTRRRRRRKKSPINNSCSFHCKTKTNLLYFFYKTEFCSSPDYFLLQFRFDVYISLSRFQPSFYLTSILYRVSEELHRVGGSLFQR